MKKVLVLTFGSRGDVQPYIALGEALAVRGAQVTLCTSKSFTSDIEAHGLSPAPLSVDVQTLAQTPEMKQALKSVRGRLSAMRTGKELVARQLEEMWRVAQDVRPDVIVYHPKAAAAPYFARALGAIAVPSFLQPGYLPTRRLPPVVVPFPDLGPIANRTSNAVIGALIDFGFRSLIKPWLKTQTALTAGGGLAAFDGYHPDAREVPRLHAFSSHLAPEPDDWAQRDYVTGAWVLNESDAAPDAALVQFLSSGPPPVYIGFGSMPDDNPEQSTRMVIDAVQRAGVRAVLAAGWGGLTIADAPETIHMIESAPHDWLFPRCSAVVHHGGAGTTHQGLRCGRPTLVCPVFGDQPFWGKRIAAIGAGPHRSACES